MEVETDAIANYTCTSSLNKQTYDLNHAHSLTCMQYSQKYKYVDTIATLAKRSATAQMVTKQGVGRCFCVCMWCCHMGGVTP